MKKKNRLTNGLLAVLLMALLITGVTSIDDALAQDFTPDTQETVFDEDIIEYSEKTRVDEADAFDRLDLAEEPEDNVEATTPTHEEILEILKEHEDHVVQGDIENDEDFFMELDGPRLPIKRGETLQDELDAISGLPDDLRQDLEEEIRAKYSTPRFRLFSAAPQARAARNVTRSELTYDIISSAISGDNLVLKGYALPPGTQNLYGSKTHRITIILRNASSGQEHRYATNLGTKDMSKLMSYNGYRNCTDSEYNSETCNYIFKNVDFTTSINLKALNPNVNYDMFLEMETFAHQASNSKYNLHYRIPVYHQQAKPLTGTLSDGRKVEYHSDFKNTQMYTTSPYLIARQGPSKTSSGWDHTQACGPNGKVAYLEQGAARGTFKTIYEVRNVDDVNWYKLRWSYSRCAGGTGGTDETITRVRNRLKEGTTNYLWSTSPFMTFAGQPLRISSITPATAQESHVGTDGKVFYNGPIESRWFGEKWAFTKRSIADYEFQKTSGHASSGTFDNGSNKHVRTVFNYTPKNGDVRIVKQDETGKPVAGVVFEVSYYSDFRAGQTWKYTTDSAGTILSKNWKPQTIYYREVSVPSPLIINSGTKSTTIKSNQTVGITVKNPIAKGSITINKVDEYGTALANVKFRIKNSAGATVKDVLTNSNGQAVLGDLALGRYTIEEMDVKAHYIKPDVVTVDLNYSNQSTPVVVSTQKVVNRFKPVATIGVNKLRVNTQAQNKGLIVEAWLDKDVHYDWNLNQFRNARVTITLEDYNTGSRIDSQTYTIEAMPTFMQFNVPASLLKKGDKKDFRVTLEVAQKNQVTIGTKRSLAIDGYTAEELTYPISALNGATINESKVVRTERTFGKPIEYFYEHHILRVPEIEALRTGSALTYGVNATYKNDLQPGVQKYYDMVLTAQGDILEANGPEYTLENNLYPSGKPNGTQADKEKFGDSTSGMKTKLNRVGDRYAPVQLYAKKDVASRIITQSEFDKLSSKDQATYRKVEGDLVTSLWDADIKIHHGLDVLVKPMGVHNIGFNISNKIDTYAFLYGHFENANTSQTIADDKVIVSPITNFDGNNDGLPDIWEDGKVPDNWGVALARSNKVLTETEREFFGYDDIVYRFYAVFDTDGGDSPAIPAQTVINGAKVSAPTNPTKEGYTFTGWSPSIDTPVTDDMVFVAQWKLNTYTISFDSDGGNAIPSQVVEHGSTPVVPTPPTKTGYTFAGWSPAVNTPVIGARTHKALWTANKYTVSFDSAGGSAVGSQSVDYSKLPTTPANPTRTGYTFAGWSPALNTPVTAHRTHTAKWTVNKYTVTFNSNGGSAVASQSVEYGKTPVTPTSPTRAGYRFTGWSPAVNTAVSGNRTHTAQWIKQAEIIHMLGSVGAEGATSGDYGFGASEDFTLVGGQKYYHETSGYVNAQAKKDGKILASYLYDLNWNWSSINKIDKQGASTADRAWSGANFTAPKSQTYRVNNYMFASGGSRTGRVTVSSNQLYLHADNAVGKGTTYIWKPIDVGSKYTLPQPQMSRTGKTFGGWLFSQDGKVYQPGATVTITGTDKIRFSAVWNNITYTASFNTAGTSQASASANPANQTVIHGQKVKAPANPTRKGHTFAGWSPAITTPITGNTKFTAKWNAHTYGEKFMPTKVANLQHGLKLSLHTTEYYLGNHMTYVAGELTIGNANQGARRSGTAYFSLNENGKVRTGSKAYVTGAGQGNGYYRNLAWLRADINNPKGTAWYMQGSITSSSNIGSGTTPRAAMMNMGLRPFDPKLHEAMSVVEDLIPKEGLVWEEIDTPEIHEEYQNYRHSQIEQGLVPQEYLPPQE